MSLSEKAGAALEALGLTKSEVRAYVALVGKGPMNASEISRAARIPYSKVYDALQALHTKGWIDEQHSRPILYTAKSPNTAMEEMNSRYGAERKEKELLALKELTGIYENKGEQERPEIWILRGTAQILSQLRSLVLDCRNEMLIALPTAIAPYAEEVVALLMALKEKGVRIEVLTGSDLDKEAVALLSTVAEVRMRNTLYGGGVIADSKQVVLLLGGGETEGAALAIWADHVGLAVFAKDYFQMLWNSEDTKRK
ncbi:MAG: TrmB family transcriptional regulator [Nitrososphaerota archaeon]|nr:TrmB family transcriptional regulator [Nitrososphaerota archaeon]